MNSCSRDERGKGVRFIKVGKGQTLRIKHEGQSGFGTKKKKIRILEWRMRI